MTYKELIDESYKICGFTKEQYQTAYEHNSLIFYGKVEDAIKSYYDAVVFLDNFIRIKNRKNLKYCIDFIDQNQPEWLNDVCDELADEEGYIKAFRGCSKDNKLTHFYSLNKEYARGMTFDKKESTLIEVKIHKKNVLCLGLISIGEIVVSHPEHVIIVSEQEPYSNIFSSIKNTRELYQSTYKKIYNSMIKKIENRQI